MVTLRHLAGVDRCAHLFLVQKPAMTSQANVAQLVLAHHGFVKSLALRFAPWPGLTDDITQQVFLEFLAKGDKWDLTTDVKPLLATMTQHIALRCWRDRTRQMPEVVRELAEHIRRLAEQSENADRWDDEVTALKQCIEKLPEKSCSLIELHYFVGTSSVDLAKHLAMKTEAVRQALCRLRGQLRNCIEKTLAGAAHA